MARKKRAREADQLETVPFARAVAALAPPSDFEASVQEALSAVQTAVGQVFGEKAWVLPFGSLIQGVHLLGSDLDLCMEVPGIKEALSSNGKPDNTAQVAALRRLLNKLPKPLFYLIEQRLWKHIKVPIIILGHTSSTGAEVETDISVGVVFEGVEKGFTDRIIRRVLALTPRALHMARLIKLWAKVEGLNKAYDGFLNSLGWTLLVIYFFMERGEVTADYLEIEEINERGLDDGAALPPPLDPGSEDDVPLSEEVADFFDLVAGFEQWPEEEASGAWGLSLVDGSMVNVPPIKKQYADQIDFFLEDPGIKLSVGRSENVARALKKVPWHTTLTKCREAASDLRSDSVTAADDWVAGLVTKCEAAAAAKSLGAVPAAGAWKRPWEAPAAQPAWDIQKRMRGNNLPQQPQVLNNWAQMQQMQTAMAAAWTQNGGMNFAGNAWGQGPLGAGPRGGGERGGAKRRGGGGGWAYKQ